MKAKRQSYLRMLHTTSGGAAIAPTDEPMLNQPVATERSLAGNHSPTTFNPAGITDDSAPPKRARQRLNCHQFTASPCSMLAADQANANSAKPIRVPTRSSTYPAM